MAQARRVRRVAATGMIGAGLSGMAAWAKSGSSTAGLDGLLVAPYDLRPRDASFWPEVDSGILGLASAAAPLPDSEARDGSPFDVDPPSAAWARALHGFDWLRHIEAAEDSDAETWARDVVLDWLDRRDRHPPIAMAPAVRARRVLSWLSASTYLLDLAEPNDFDRIMAGLTADAAALATQWRRIGDVEGRMTAIVALTACQLALDEDRETLATTVRALVGELDRQVLPDGGHISRDPSVLMRLLFDWLALKSCFEGRAIPPPPRLTGVISAGLAMLRVLRLGDGGLARFNGVGPADPGALATLMAYDEQPAPGSGWSAASGYARLVRGRTVVVVDAGAPPPIEASGHAHAGCLSLEICAGQALLVVNVGAPGPADEGWRAISRATASHSTMTLSEMSSAELLRDPRLCEPGVAQASGDALALVASGTVAGAVSIGAGPTDIGAAGVEPNGVEPAGDTFEGTHEGYVARTGLVHRRTVALSADGDRIMVTDRLQAARRGMGADEVPFALHIHLHPETTVAPYRDGMTTRGDTLLLSLADGTRWMFQSQGARAAIEDSTFLAGGFGPQPSLQIVLRGATIGGVDISWSLIRIGDDGLPRLAKSAAEEPRTTGNESSEEREE